MFPGIRLVARVGHKQKPGCACAVHKCRPAAQAVAQIKKQHNLPQNLDHKSLRVAAQVTGQSQCRSGQSQV